MCVGSKNTLLQVEIASVQTTIGKIENLKMPSTKPLIIGCKDLDDNYETLHADGSIERGQCQASLFYDPTDDQHELMVNNVHSSDFTAFTSASRKRNWNILFNQLATPRSWTFVGIANQFDVTAAVGEPLKADLGIEVERSTTLPV